MNTVARRRTVIILAVVAALAAAVAVARVWIIPDGGLSPDVSSADTAQSQSRTSAPAQTAAPAPAPLGFPDLDELTDVSPDHDVSRSYPSATFTSPTGLQCAMWSNRGSTAASCFGEIPGLDHPANYAYAGDYKAYLSQNTSPAADSLNGKPLASGQKVILGAGGTLLGGDQITCGVTGNVVACVVIRDFRRNHGDATAQRHGFVLDPQRSWTF